MGKTITSLTAAGVAADTDLVEVVQGGVGKKQTFSAIWTWIKANTEPATFTNVREKLTANRTYYVRTDGSDANDGLTNTAGGAFLTIQKAINVVGAIDIASFTVTIKLGNSGTFSGAAVVGGPWVGTGTVILEGDTVTPANTIVTHAGDAVAVKASGRLTVQYFELQSTTAGGVCLRAESAGAITQGPGMRFGPTGVYHYYCIQNGTIYGRNAYTVTGGGAVHYGAEDGGVIDISGVTVTITGTPAFSYAFAGGQRLGQLNAYSNTFSGAATGTRYIGYTNALIFTNGGGANYFPGSVAGSVSTGAQYV